MEADRSDRDKISATIKGLGDKSVPGSAVSNVKIPKEAYSEASSFLKHAGRDGRFSVGSDRVYDMLLKSIRREAKCEELLGGWKKACESLIRYALNLFLAPRKQEYRKLRLSSSFFMNNVEKNLKNAKFFLEAMGYAEKEKGELHYDGSVEMKKVLDVLTDLVILSSEIDFIEHNILRTKNCSIEDAIKARNDDTFVWKDLGEHNEGPSSLSSEKSVDYNTGQVEEMSGFTGNNGVQSEGSKDAQPQAFDPSALPEPAFHFPKKDSSDTKTMGDRSHSADNLLSSEHLGSPGLEYQRSQSSDDGSQDTVSVLPRTGKRLVTSQSVDKPNKKPTPTPRMKLNQETHSNTTSSGKVARSSPEKPPPVTERDKYTLQSGYWKCSYCTNLNTDAVCIVCSRSRPKPLDQ